MLYIYNTLQNTVCQGYKKPVLSLMFYRCRILIKLKAPKIYPERDQQALGRGKIFTAACIDIFYVSANNSFLVGLN